MRKTFFGAGTMFFRVLAALLWLFPAATALAQQPAPAAGQGVTAVAAPRAEAGFGRLILQFSEPVRTEAQVVGAVAVLRFDRPVQISVEKIATQLPGYVAAVRLDPDRKAMRIALTQALRGDLKNAAEDVYFDLLPAVWRGPAPSLPREVVENLAKRAREAGEAVRAARSAAAPAQQVAAAVATTISVSVARNDAVTRLTFQLPPAHVGRLLRTGSDALVFFEGKARTDMARLDEAALRAGLAGVVAGVRFTDEGGAPALHFRAPAGTEIESATENGAFVVDIVMSGARPRLSVGDARAVTDSDPPASPPVAAPIVAAPAPEAPPAREQAMPAPPASSPVTARLVAGKDGVALLISPRLPAAVFQRGGAVHVVVQGGEAAAAPVVDPAAQPLITAATGEQKPGYALFTFRTRDRGLVSVQGEAAGWRVVSADLPAGDTRPLRLMRDRDGEGRAILRAAMPQPGAALTVDIPGDAGARLLVAPMAGAPHGLAAPQTFVEVTALASALGLVVETRSEDVSLASEGAHVVIASDAGLSLSAQQGRRHLTALRAFDPAQWAKHRRGAVRDGERTLFRIAADAPRREIGAARLNLAGFYLANGLANEAAGVISVALAEEPALAGQRPVQMAQALGAIMQDNITEAARLLAAPALGLDAEAALLRAYIDARAHRHKEAVAGVRRAGDMLETMPEGLQAMLLPSFVRAGIAAKDNGFAARQLSLLARLDGNERDVGVIDLLRGEIAEAGGHRAEALASYAKAARSPVRPIEAEARLAQVLLQQAGGASDAAAGRAELETVAMIWRRGDVEARAQARLGEMAVTEGRWRDAFAAARRAVEIQPEHPATRALQDEMGRRFEGLFMEGSDARITRVEALAIFDEFRALIPPGPKGDDIVRKLAERLAELDLIPQAAELLAYQVRARLKGAARAEAAARLAALHMMDGKPEEALKALRGSRFTPLAPETRRARVLMEARALGDMGQIDLALETMAAETGDDVERLRADVHWRGKRWQEAAEAYERALGVRWRETAPLNPVERSDALRAAVAYGLATDKLGADRLRGKFLKLMADTPDADMFRLATIEPLSRPDAFREAAESAVSARSMAGFLEAYRKRFPPAKAGG